MNAEEYAARQAVISSAVAHYVLQTGKFFAPQRLNPIGWLLFLRAIYPEVKQRYEESAALAREFYDFERSRQRPDLARNDVFLEELTFEKFVADMTPVREKMSRENARESDVAQVALQVTREVENGGRRQIIHAVEDDPLEPLPDVDVSEPAESGGYVDVRERIRRLNLDRYSSWEEGDDLPDPERDRPPPDSRPVVGWARIATGRETCAWCLMLISRGPVYRSAESAGLDLDDESVEEMFAAGEDVREHMDQWHPGCDCKVVPVYDKQNWPGFEEWKRAEDLWIEASREAEDLIASGDSRTTSRYRETLNALRRRLDRGEIDPRVYAAAA